jgi:NADPH-dependent 2,4-dienoyl-CoA reductase/sulfur reductase-like enzyme/nitrite reductase/ring-hydroxylating ferredoxin subunit
MSRFTERTKTVGEAAAPTGPDFAAGISLRELPDPGRTLAGHVGEEPVLLSNFDGELFAVGGSCTHYGAALSDGMIHGTGIRCPLHHACFDLRNGKPLRAPGLDPLDCWQVEVDGDLAFVRRKIQREPERAQSLADVRRIVIVGGGAARLRKRGLLRRLGFPGEVTILSADSDPPCDRPNLSKDYLAGTAPEEWLWLRPEGWYDENRVDLRLGAEVTRVDTDERTVGCSNGEQFPYDRLLIATGAEPNHLAVRGFDRPNVHTLRNVADARTIAAQAKPGARAVVIGASFIALEASAALRQREVEVDIVSVEKVPLDRVFGAEIGRELQRLHESKGVRFHLSAVTAGFDGRSVVLASGEQFPADFVVVGIGVRPRTGVAELAGLRIENGVIVDAQLQTSQAGIYAAGDIAAYPDPLSGEPTRIEHWAVAERQGQVAARNMLGRTERFESAPFFWTEQYGVAIRYVGRAVGWDAVTVEGSFADRSLIARYFIEGAHCASASIGRDRENLEDELTLEAR